MQWAGLRRFNITYGKKKFTVIVSAIDKNIAKVSAEIYLDFTKARSYMT